MDVISILSGIGAGMVTFFIGMLLERYKSRRLELSKKITYQKIGIPEDFYLPGKLNVTYDGHPVNSLYLFKLQLLNNSNFDSNELPISFYSDLSSYILSYSYTWVPDTTEISESEEYTTLLQRHNVAVNQILSEDKNAEIPEPLNSEGLFLQRNRMLIASSLNRGEEIELSILIGSQLPDHLPFLFLKIPASGISLVDSVDPTKKNERIGKMSIIIGIIVTLALGTSFTLLYKNYSAQFIVLSIIGATNFLIGIFIYKTIEFIHSYFK